MWGLREQIKELREALERIATLTHPDTIPTEDWAMQDEFSDIQKIARKALDKR